MNATKGPSSRGAAPRSCAPLVAPSPWCTIGHIQGPSPRLPREGVMQRVLRLAGLSVEEMGRELEDYFQRCGVCAEEEEREMARECLHRAREVERLRGSLRELLLALGADEGFLKQASPSLL